ncbi:amidase domain-containing protein [Streptomyces luomodiensis]|uniref:Amidase domain-containing protein n=1 Tax=Streptomyces luomodiensis TaxID=3026192 RepID=A0ABY9V6P5_9ACTN|nr:amidase domain-containing protein [Streptomyces sp. SCA4-21]WNF00464.1 amidase domain-containing protein [Streptomyces sp. SCA4-21]
MKSTTFRSAAVGAVLTAALSAVALPASAASAAESAAAAGTVDAATAQSFGRLADAVLTQRTAALLDNERSARRAAPLAANNVRLSAGATRAEDTALSALRTRKARLAALGEAYTSADTRVAVDGVRVEAGHATVQATETTTLTYRKVRGDEPTTTGFQAHHRLSFTAAADGTWQLTGLTSADDGPLAVNEPGTARVAAGTTALPEATPAATTVPSRPQTKPAGSYDYAAMASYAEKYWQNYNTAYRKFNDDGGDCTNFVSQALKAGGWAHQSGDYDDYHSWWYDTSYQSTSWVGANEWSWFTLDSKRATNLANVYDMGVGDVMQMDFDKDGSKDHTMVVTYRSASGVPYLTYHSVNTYRRSVASIIASYPNSAYYAYRT